MNTYNYSAFAVALKSVVCAVLVVCAHAALNAQQTGPRLVDPHLAVRPVVTNLNQPTSMAFIGPNDILVLEKPSGKVQRIQNGVFTSTVLEDRKSVV